MLLSLICAAAAAAAGFTMGVWIPAWGDVSASLWDHYSDGYKLFHGVLGERILCFQYIPICLIDLNMCGHWLVVRAKAEDMAG